jgi:hypothetical protein
LLDLDRDENALHDGFLVLPLVLGTSHESESHRGRRSGGLQGPQPVIAVPSPDESTLLEREDRLILMVREAWEVITETGQEILLGGRPVLVIK